MEGEKQMDLPGVFEEPLKEEIKEEDDVYTKESCHFCGDSGPCFACERGQQLAKEFKIRKKAS
jgi:hypothetical protein